MNDPLEKLSAMRPTSTIPPDWADSPDGQRTLRRARAAASAEMTASPRTPRRWKAALGAVAAVTVAAGAATAFGLSVRAPVDATQVMCFKTADIDGDAAGYPVPEGTPAAALAKCSSHWSEAWPGTPTPAGFAVCVYPVRPNNEGGAQVVIPLNHPAAANDCQSAGFDPVG